MKYNQGARKYKVNQKFFDKWSPGMAYVLGFWFADGFINEENFSLSQHKNDAYIITQIKKLMKAQHPIKKGNRNNVILNIYSKNIIDSIKRIGGTERKSKEVKFPFVPTKFLGDFIRGYFDGMDMLLFIKIRAVPRT